MKRSRDLRQKWKRCNRSGVSTGVGRNLCHFLYIYIYIYIFLYSSRCAPMIKVHTN